MAYIPYDEDEEDELAGGSPGQVGTGSANYAPSVTHNPSSSGKFTNFSAYFNANNGAARGDELVSGLQGPADAARTGAEKAKTDTTTKATANTIQGPAQGVTVATPVAPPPVQTVTATPTTTQKQLGAIAKSGGTWRAPQQPATQPAAPATQPAAPAPAPVQPANTITPEEAKAKGAQTYTGPTADSVDELFAPLQSQATNAQRNISMSRDAAGVKALGGRTGFEATIARAGAGGRINELQKKYGRLAGDVRDAHYDASTAAGRAELDSGTAIGGFQKLTGDYDTAEADRVAKLKERQAADLEKWNAGKWNNAWAGLPGAKEHFGGGTGKRPTGREWLAAFDPYLGAAPGSRLDRLGVSAEWGRKFVDLFDKLPDDEAMRVMQMGSTRNPDGTARTPMQEIEFLNYLASLAPKYGVK